MCFHIFYSMRYDMNNKKVLFSFLLTTFFHTITTARENNATEFVFDFVDSFDPKIREKSLVLCESPARPIILTSNDENVELLKSGFWSIIISRSLFCPNSIDHHHRKRRNEIIKLTEREENIRNVFIYKQRGFQSVQFDIVFIRERYCFVLAKRICR